MGKKKSVGFYNFAYSRRVFYEANMQSPLTHQAIVECASKEWNQMTDEERDVWVVQRHEKRKIAVKTRYRRKKEENARTNVFHEIQKALDRMDKVKEILDKMCYEEKELERAQMEVNAEREQNELADRITAFIESLFV